jgi:hypothetical protein
VNLENTYRQAELATWIRSELAKPQVMRAQVLARLTDEFQCLTEDELTLFFEERFNQLEDYEVDLLLSPQFTARIEQQQAFSQQFTYAHYPKNQLDPLVEEILSTPTEAILNTPSGKAVHVALTPVLIERFLGTLKLTRPVHAAHSEIEILPMNVQTQSAYVLRDDVFKYDKYKAILLQLIPGLAKEDDTTKELISFTAEFIKTYTPQTLEEVENKLKRLIESCQADSLTADSRSYHHEEIKAGSMGNPYDAHEAEAIRENYQRIIKQAEQVLAVIPMLK